MNVVRWSPNGRWLATGSSDGRVGLAERTANPTEFGAAAGSEVWRLRQYLAGSKMGTSIQTAFLWKFLSEAFGRDYRASTPVICSINPFSTQIANRPTFSRNFRDMGYRLVSR